jgi:hypothetical protein
MFSRNHVQGQPTTVEIRQPPGELLKQERNQSWLLLYSPLQLSATPGQSLSLFHWDRYRMMTVTVE